MENATHSRISRSLPKDPKALEFALTDRSPPIVLRQVNRKESEDPYGDQNPCCSRCAGRYDHGDGRERLLIALNGLTTNGLFDRRLGAVDLDVIKIGRKGGTLS